MSMVGSTAGNVDIALLNYLLGTLSNDAEIREPSQNHLNQMLVADPARVLCELISMAEGPTYAMLQARGEEPSNAESTETISVAAATCLKNCVRVAMADNGAGCPDDVDLIVDRVMNIAGSSASVGILGYIPSSKIHAQCSEIAAIVAKNDFQGRGIWILKDLARRLGHAISSSSHIDWSVPDRICIATNSIVRQRFSDCEFQHECDLRDLISILDCLPPTMYRAFAQAADSFIIGSHQTATILVSICDIVRLLMEVLPRHGAFPYHHIDPTREADWMRVLVGLLQEIAIRINGSIGDGGAEEGQRDYEHDLVSVMDALFEIFVLYAKRDSSGDNNSVSLLQPHSLNDCDEPCDFRFEVCRLVWMILKLVCEDDRYDDLVSKAICFITHVAGTGMKNSDAPDIIVFGLERIIDASSEEEEEKDEDDPQLFLFGEAEGKKKDCLDLLLAMYREFESATVDTLSIFFANAISEYEAGTKDQSKMWQKLSICMELLLEIARETNVLPEELKQYPENLFKPALNVLLEGRNATLQFYLPAFRAVLLKFMGEFVDRTEQWHNEETFSLLMGSVVDHLHCQSVTVHTTAANTISNAIGALTTNRSVEKGQLRSYLSNTDNLVKIFEGLAKIIELPGPRNGHVMECFAKAVAIMPEPSNRETIPAIYQILIGVLLDNLEEMADCACKGCAWDANYNYYLFESIAKIIRKVSDKSFQNTQNLAIDLSRIFYPPFRKVIEKEASDFTPFVYQIVALVLECLPDYDMGIEVVSGKFSLKRFLPDGIADWTASAPGDLLLNRKDCEDATLDANIVPAVCRIFKAFLEKLPKKVTKKGCVPSLMKFAMKWISSNDFSRNNETRSSVYICAFDLLETIIRCVDLDEHLSHMWTGIVFYPILNKISGGDEWRPGFKERNWWNKEDLVMFRASGSTFLSSFAGIYGPQPLYDCLNQINVINNNTNVTLVCENLWIPPLLSNDRRLRLDPVSAKKHLVGLTKVLGHGSRYLLSGDPISTKVWRGLLESALDIIASGDLPNDTTWDGDLYLKYDRRAFDDYAGTSLRLESANRPLPSHRFMPGQCAVPVLVLEDTSFVVADPFNKIKNPRNDFIRQMSRLSLSQSTGDAVQRVINSIVKERRELIGTLQELEKAAGTSVKI